MGDMIDRDAVLNIIAGEGLHILDKAIRALPAEPAEDVRAGALKEAAAIARHYAETDYCAMGYPEDGGIAASGTAHMIEGDILALIPEAKP